MMAVSKVLAGFCLVCVVGSVALGGEPNDFEVVAVGFGELHQGEDNSVRMTIRNVSGQEQIFAVHIQSYSPDYGGRGCGWGRQFFETLKGGETREMMFAFGIVGPVTEASWVRLQFYNPASVEGWDYDRWFWKRVYGYDRLVEFGVDSKRRYAAGPRLAGFITGKFVALKGYVRQGQHQKFWEMITEDFQGELEDYATFAEIVDLYAAELLALKVDCVEACGEVATLLASGEGLQFAAEFVEVEGQWRIRWMRLRPKGGWKGLVLGRMQKLSTEHFDIYYHEGSTAEKEKDLLAEQKERGYREICGFLGEQSELRIELVLFETGRKKRLATGHEGAGWAFGNTIVEVYNEQEKLDPYHETVHILMGSHGSPPALLNEGFAVYMSERLGGHGLGGLGGGRSSVHERVRELRQEGEFIPLAELIHYVEIGSSESRPLVAYPEAASFVKFLIDRYGKEKFLEAYKTLQNSEDLHERQKNVERLAEIYGVSFQELAGQWEDFLAGAGAASDQ